jgi:hypothetical protein
MLFTILFVALLVSQMVRVTLRRMDAWPFSHYPMFSGLTDLPKVEVFRVALETAEGEIIWWRSRFYRDPQEIGSQLKRAAAREKEHAQFQRHLSEVLRLIRLEEGDVNRYRALHIIRRTVREDYGGALLIDDRPIATIPVEAIGSIG